jgi:predicted Zn-dependent protease
VLTLSEVEYAEEIGAALGLGVQYGLLLPYSRKQELEADRLGVELMHSAGFDARAAVTLWQAMDAANRGRPPEVLATHPAPRSRIREIEEMLPDLT